MENIYFKCKIDNLAGIKKEQGDDVWYIFLEKLQKTWPTDKKILFNKGTENECEVQYTTISRIDSNPIFKIVKGEMKNVESGVSGYINDIWFESNDIVFIEDVLNNTKKLKNGVTVVHRKYNRLYKVVECNMRIKDSVKGWVDAVAYAPLYENEYNCFAREKQSFIDEFDIVGAKTYKD